MDLNSLLNSLTAWLSGLGPWGPLLGIGATLLVFFLRNRFGPQPNPVTPTPAPSPANNPLRLDGQFPLLNKLLSALLGKRGDLNTHDIPHATLIQLREETGALIATKAAEHAAALADLDPDPDGDVVED